MTRASLTSSRGRARLFLAGAAALLVAGCADAGDPLPTAPGAPLESAAPAPPGLQDFGPAIRAAKRHTPALMAHPAVVGTGVGLDDQGRPSVRLFLLHDHVAGLPRQLDGVPVSTRVTGRFMIRADRTARARPAPIGFSVGHPDITAGTLGARVSDGTNVFILSNNHVLANSNNASLGDPALQPGAFDGGSVPGDLIGTLYDFEPIVFGGAPNEMDAAIALVSANDVSGSPPAGAAYAAPGTNPTSATVGMAVQKYGRTTGHTLGTVAEINVTVSVCFQTRGPFMCALSATFVNQFTITPGDFSAGGDSGSLIVRNTTQANPVGLLFAGSSTRTIANPIGAVLSRFNVSIDPTVPDGTEPPPPEEGTLTGVVGDADTGDGIGGATVAVAGTGLSATTASNGTYTIENVPAGTHEVTASAAGYASQSAPATVQDGQTTTLDFELEPDATEPPPEGTVSVSSIAYSGSGGPQQNRHLQVTITLVDDGGNPVAGASVSATLLNQSTGATWNRSGTSGSNGTFSFQLNNAPSGCYTTTVTDVSADGLDWDGQTPENDHCK